LTWPGCIAGFRPGPEGTGPLQFCSRPSSFVATHDYFAKITQMSAFFAFSNCRKVGKFAASIKRQKNKSASTSGGIAPLPPDQELSPWTPRALGAVPLDPCYRLTLSRLPWGCAFLQMLRARTVTARSRCTLLYCRRPRDVHNLQFNLRFLFKYVSLLG